MGLFRKKEEHPVPPMPSWEEVVEQLHDKGLDWFAQEVVEVLYSQDGAMRYVILRRDSGVLSYVLQKICMEDPEEWERLHSIGLLHPIKAGWWESVPPSDGSSFFNSLADLREELQREWTYETYFAK